MTKRTVKFWIESCLAAASGVLCIVTLITPDWIEVVFHVDPDRGSGALEWMIVAGLLVLALVSGGLARREQRRASARLTSPDAIP
jgi:hypothetical protein